MRKKLIVYALGFALFLPLPILAEQAALKEELRAELAQMKVQMARIEALLERLEKERSGTLGTPAVAELEPAAGEAKPAESLRARRAPALNTPPVLPASRVEAFRKAPPGSMS